MKNLIRSAVCVGIIACCQSFAFASDYTEIRLAEIPVAASETEAYNLNIEWNNIIFDCERIWNPDTHSYDSPEFNQGRVRVANDSGASVTVTLTFVPVDDLDIAVDFAPASSGGDDLITTGNAVSFVLPPLGGAESETEMILSLSDYPGDLLADDCTQIGGIHISVAPAAPPPEDEVAGEKPPATAEEIPAEDEAPAEEPITPEDEPPAEETPATEEEIPAEDEPPAEEPIAPADDPPAEETPTTEDEADSENTDRKR